MHTDKKLKAWLAAVSVIAYFLLVTVIIMALRGSGEVGPSGQPGEATRTKAVTTKVAPIPATFADIFDGEESRAFYNGKAVEVSGSIVDFFGARYPDIYFRMGDGSVEGAVKCHFTDSAEIAKLAELEKGTSVIVIGVYNVRKGLRDCSIRRADGKEIKPTPAPLIKDGVCVLTVEEYLAMDFARNQRGEVLLDGAKVQIIAKVTGFSSTNFRWIQDYYYIYIGTKNQEIRCGSSYGAYMEVSTGDMVTVHGWPSQSTSTDFIIDTYTVEKATF